MKCKDKKIAQKKSVLNKGRDEQKRNLERKPDWLRVPIPSGDNFKEIKSKLREKKLYTV